MGFYIYSTDDGRVPAIEYMPCGAITPKIGMALTLTSGNLALASGTTAPSYISMCQKEEACTAGELIPVIRAGHDIIFQSTFSAAASSVVPGSKVTIGSDGLSLTGTTTGGVAEVVQLDGTAVGSAVRLRF